ncbi:MAG: hypothetical protein WC141_05155 [Arcobacteraceae bacterium]
MKQWQINRQKLEEYSSTMRELSTETILFEYENLTDNFVQNGTIKNKKQRLLLILKERGELDRLN